ncbi:MAG: hypothetical protein P0Y64_10095 [Candidatus Sphingomonas colombiensis]|nr:hypothetical protein [Sphingomonas sp.]WEK41765.1 MAG: hypothetical protein P0Y64_10095 [Sphingomonas sp.]
MRIDASAIGLFRIKLLPMPDSMIERSAVIQQGGRVVRWLAADKRGGGRHARGAGDAVLIGIAAFAVDLGAVATRCPAAAGDGRMPPRSPPHPAIRPMGRKRPTRWF